MRKVIRWQRPFAVMCVSTIAGAIECLTMVVQKALSMMVSDLPRSLLWICCRGWWLVSYGGSCIARMSMSRFDIISLSPVGLYCLAMLSDAIRVWGPHAAGAELILMRVGVGWCGVCSGFPRMYSSLRRCMRVGASSFVYEPAGHR